MTDSTPTGTTTPIKEIEPLHPGWPVWSCKLEALGTEEAKPLTVGAKQLLKCEGESIAAIKELPSFTFSDEAQVFALHPLELSKSDANSVELIVTTYKPGPHQFKWIEVASGDAGFRTENLSTRVESVLPPGQPSQPTTDVGAFKVAYPLWMWISLLLLVLIPSLWLIQRLRRKAQIKKLVSKLATSNSALRPYDQFSKDMRGLVRQYNFHADPKLAVEFTAKMNEAFKTYLTRAFRLPALVWSPGQFVAEIKRIHKKTYQDILKDLKNALLEINKTEASGHASPEDADQLRKLAMVLAERIFKIQEDKAKR